MKHGARTKLKHKGKKRERPASEAAAGDGTAAGESSKGYDVIVAPTTESEPLDKDAVASVVARLLRCTVLGATKEALPPMTALFVRSTALRTSDDAAVRVTIAEEDAAVRAADLEMKLEEVLGQPVVVEAPKRVLTAAEKLTAAERAVDEGRANADDVWEQRKRVERERFTENFVRSIDEGEAKSKQRKASKSGSQFGTIGKVSEAKLHPSRSIVLFGCPPRMDSIEGAADLLYQALVDATKAASERGGGDVVDVEKQEAEQAAAKALYRRVLLAERRSDVVRQVVVRTDASGAFKGVLLVELADDELAAFAVGKMGRTTVDGARVRIKKFDPRAVRTTAAIGKPADAPAIVLRPKI